MHKVFLRIHYWIASNKVWAGVLALFYLLVTIGALTQLKMEEDIMRLIPRSESSDRANQVLNQLEFADKVTVLIRTEEEGDTDDLLAVADAFLQRLEGVGPFIGSVQGRVSEEGFDDAFEFVYDNLPLFLNPADYTAIAGKLAPDSVKSAVNANYRALTAPGSFMGSRRVMEDPLGLVFMGLRKLQALNAGSSLVIEDGFLLTGDRKNLLLFLNPAYRPNDTEKNAVLADSLYQIQKELAQEWSGKAKVEYHGAALIAVANAKQIKRDIALTMAVAMTILMGILMVYYRRLYVPLLLFIPTVFGVLLATTVLFLIKDSISAISLSIGAILLGVTIDYALHILTHRKHSNNVEELYRDIARPVLMSSTTTAVAFLCLLFVHSEALRDLGIFAAISVIASALFSLLLIPHLYRPEPAASASNTGMLDRISRYPFEKSRFLIGLCVMAIAVSLFYWQRVGFNEDISRLNYVPEEIRNTEKHLEEATHLMARSRYLVSFASTLDSALELNRAVTEQLRRAKEARQVQDFHSPSDIMHSSQAQQQKLEEWRQFWTPEKKKALLQQLRANGRDFGLVESAYDGFAAYLDRTFETVDYQRYLEYQDLGLGDFIGNKGGWYTVTTLVKVEEDETVVDQLKDNPSLLVVDRQHLNETFLGNLKNDFNRLVNLSFLAVLAILWLFFRRLELVFISAIPIAITGLVTAGLMGVFGIELNIFSTIVCTLIFGHGVDFSIFMTSALQKEYTTGRDEMPLYRTSVLLAVITTVLAIGALIFASHPALKSISAVSLVGVTAAVLITFVFYPILFRALIIARPAAGKSPVRLVPLVSTLLSFTYYGLGGVVFSLVSTVASFWPGKQEGTKLFLRKWMAKFMKSVLDSCFNLRKTRIINTSGEDFKKPAVLIANHSSFLDILTMGMLHPKTVFLVSDWVYNSPIFGKGVRFLGFYPVSRGLEQGLEALQEKIEAGYSVMVFPEGTRSRTNAMGRFHKGAFYLAEHFGMDIVPVILHGGAEVFAKGDFLIRNYGVTARILPRIASDSTAFGVGYRERTKQISAYFKAEYQALRQALEGPSYFREILLENYVYKEASVQERVLEKLLEKEEQLFSLEPKLSSKAKILHIADDFGERDLLLVLRQPERKVVSWIQDKRKREVAQNNYISRSRKLVYLEELPDAHGFDVLLISCDAALPVGYADEFPAVFKLPDP